MNRNIGPCGLLMGDCFSQALNSASEYLSDRATDFTGTMDECSFRECASNMHGQVKHYAYPDPEGIGISDED